MANIQGLLDKYKNKPDERFFAELFQGEEYKPLLERKLDVVLDIGALAGEFSAYVYEKAGIIHCIEPYDPYYNELASNIKEFNLTKMIPYNLAILNYSGECHISTEDVRGGNRVTENKEGSQPSKCETIASFMMKNSIDHVDVLKIDIENMEAHVFSSPDFKDVVGKIDCIVGEHLTDGAGVILEGYGFTKTEHMHNLIYERTSVNE